MKTSLHGPRPAASALRASCARIADAAMLARCARVAVAPLLANCTRVAVAALLAATPLLSQAAAPGHVSEADYYAVDYLSPPAGAVLEVGGMDWLSDGRLIVSTRRGQVWIVQDALAANPADARFTLFAEGLDEGLGLKVLPDPQPDGVRRDAIYVVQRGELSRLWDTDGNDACDMITTISQDFGVSGNYHEFAFGLPADDAGNLYMTLNVGFGDPKWWIGQSFAPWRGWALRIDPATGVTTPVASGLRSPAGHGRNAAGDIFITDNQGDWLPACPVVHLEEGAWYGHPASLRWADEYVSAGAMPNETIPQERARLRPVAWLPYKWARSAGSLVEDSTAGGFGPFAGQMFVAEMTNGQMLRLQLEKVRGKWQGSSFQFRQKVGSALRVLFAPDGTLFCGLTNRGWGGVAPGDGIARVRWNGRTPMEIHSVHLLQDGFEVTFTEPVADDIVLTPADVSLQQYDYDWWWEYGSPERHTAPVAVSDVSLSPDRRTLTLHAPVAPAMMARCVLSGVRGASGAPLLHGEFNYTVNQLPEGPATELYIAKAVAPPPPRAAGNEGWLYLTWVDATALFAFEGWTHCDAELDPSDDATLVLKTGDGALVNASLPAPADISADGATAVADAGANAPHPASADEAAPRASPPDAAAPHAAAPSASATTSSSAVLAAVEARRDAPSDYVTLHSFGDSRVHIGFMLPAQGRSALVLQERYAIELSADDACGTVLLPDGKRIPPALPCWRGPGEWHDLELIFEAPRFAADGHKSGNARIARVLVDDILLHENVELPGPSAGWDGPEGPLAPLAIAGRLGSIAVRDIRVRPAPPSDASDVASRPWIPIFNGENLDGWKTSGEATWAVEDGVLTGSGKMGHLFSPRGDFRDFEVRASLKISDQGNSGLYVRAAFGDGWPAGYEAQVNSTHTDRVRTGSLYGLALVHTQLIPAGTWFDYEVSVRDEPAGTHLVIKVNGIVITDYVDAGRLHDAGHIALQQHHEGSVVECRRLEVRELPPAGR